MAKNERLRDIIDEIKFREKMTQEEIANALGISKQYLSDAINSRYPFSRALQRKIHELYPYIGANGMNSGTVVGANVSGNGNSISNNDSIALSKAMDEIAEMHKIIQEQVKNNQVQFDRLMAVIEQLTNKMK